MDMHLEPSGELAESGIWDEKVRGELFKPKYKKSDLDKRRNAVSCEVELNVLRSL